MKIVFAGTPQNAADVLKRLHSSGLEIALVVTREDAPVGRHRVLAQSPVAEVAEILSIPVLKSNKLNAAEIEVISESQAELGVVVAFGCLLSQDALNSLPLGWINLHYSLLPNWRGAAPVQRAILSGNSLTGISVFQLDSGLDTGDVWAQLEVEIQPEENSAELLNRMGELGAGLLNEVIPKIFSRTSQPTKQNVERGITLAPKTNRAEARIDWHTSAKQIELQVRAFNPEPMAYTEANGTGLIIAEAIAVESGDLPAEPPGTVFAHGKRVLVACGSRSLLQLSKVKPAGKNLMAAADWLRGATVKQLG